MSATILYVLVLFSAVAHAIWNSLVKSAGDRVLTMVTIRFTGLVLGLATLPFVDLPHPESWKWLLLTACVQFGYYAVLIRSYDLGDMSVVYPLARGIAPVVTTIAAFVSLHEALGPLPLAAIGLISFGIMVLSLRAGASGVAVGYACTTGLAVAAYSLFGGFGVRTAGTVLGFQVFFSTLDVMASLAFWLGHCRSSAISPFLQQSEAFLSGQSSPCGRPV
jgi:drug/metabolite transporter (DMT)-like permease